MHNIRFYQVEVKNVGVIGYVNDIHPRLAFQCAFNEYHSLEPRKDENRSSKFIHVNDEYRVTEVKQGEQQWPIL